MASQNGGTLASALLGFQSAAPALQRDKINPHFRSKYLSLEALMEQVLPLLNEHGLVLIQQPGYETVYTEHPSAALAQSHTPILTTTLLHVESGDKLESKMLLQAAKDDPQGQGSAITYARRQALMSMLGLVADADDDANRAQRRPARPAATGARSAPAPDPTPEATPETAQDAGAAPEPANDPARTRTLIGVANTVINEIQNEFGDHPDGLSWADRMTQKVQEWFGHGLDELTTKEAAVLVQRLRATRTKLVSNRDKQNS